MTWIPTPRLNPAPVIKRRGRRIISFRRKDDRYGWMGNMPHFEVEHQGVRYKSSEHLFQSLRYEGHPRIQKRIREHPNSLYMKKTVHKRSVHLIDPLDPKEDRERMLVCLRAKVAAHPWTRPCQASGGEMVCKQLSRSNARPAPPVPTHNPPSRSSQNDKIQSEENPVARLKIEVFPSGNMSANP